MKYLLLIALAGCAELPTIKACGEMEYKRVGLDYEVHATKCRVQVNDITVVPVR